MANDNNVIDDDFDFEFHSEVEQPLDELRDEAEQRLRKLAAHHKDLIGASIAVDEPAENRASNYIYRARVVAYVRPDNVAAVEHSDSVEAALKGALDAVERQVRERRDKLRERWKQP